MLLDVNDNYKEIKENLGYPIYIYYRISQKFK